MNANLSSYVGAIPFFIYLIYLVGRTYITTYLSQLGVPNIILSTNEFISHGTKIDTLGIAFVFSLLLVGLIRYIRYKPEGNDEPKASRINEAKRKGPKWLAKLKEFNKKTPPYIVTLYYIWAAVLFIYSSISFAFSNAPYHPAMLMMIIMPLIVLIGFNIFFLLWGYSYIAWCRARRRMSAVLTITLILQLAFFPSVGSMAWGAFRGYLDCNNLKTINIIAERPIIDSVEWNPNLQGDFTSDNLSLIYINSEYLIVKSKANNINILEKKDILSITRNEPKLSTIYAPK